MRVYKRIQYVRSKKKTLVDEHLLKADTFLLAHGFKYFILCTDTYRYAIKYKIMVFNSSTTFTIPRNSGRIDIIF